MFFYSQEIVKTKDGKSIKLNPDKTWEYVEVKWSFINENDFIVSDDILQTIDGTKVSIYDGKDNDVLCNFSLRVYDKTSSFKEFKDLDKTSIMQMVLEISTKSKYSLKNKNTYNPLKIQLNFMDGLWFASCDYTGQNDFGATKDSNKIMFFYPNGKKISDEELIKMKKK